MTDSMAKTMRETLVSIAACLGLSLGSGVKAQELAAPATIMDEAVSGETIVTERYAELERETADLAEKLLLLDKINRDLLASEKELRKKLADVNLAVKRFSRSLAQRTFRNVSRHVAGITGSSIPYVGAGVQVGMTQLDVREGCKTLEDLNEMIRIMDLEPVDADRVCAIKVPTVDEVIAQVIGNWRTTYAVAAAWANQNETQLPPDPPVVPQAGANELWIAVFGSNPVPIQQVQSRVRIAPRPPTPPTPPLPPSMSRP